MRRRKLSQAVGSIELELGAKMKKGKNRQTRSQAVGSRGEKENKGSEGRKYNWPKSRRGEGWSYSHGSSYNYGRRGSTHRSLYELFAPPWIAAPFPV